MSAKLGDYRIIPQDENKVVFVAYLVASIGTSLYKMSLTRQRHGMDNKTKYISYVIVYEQHAEIDTQELTM